MLAEGEILARRPGLVAAVLRGARCPASRRLLFPPHLRGGGPGPGSVARPAAAGGPGGPPPGLGAAAQLPPRWGSALVSRMIQGGQEGTPASWPARRGPARPGPGTGGCCRQFVGTKGRRQRAEECSSAVTVTRILPF